jgi:serine/threonine protein kinase
MHPSVPATNNSRLLQRLSVILLPAFLLVAVAHEAMLSNWIESVISSANYLLNIQYIFWFTLITLSIVFYRIVRLDIYTKSWFRANKRQGDDVDSTVMEKPASSLSDEANIPDDKTLIFSVRNDKTRSSSALLVITRCADNARLGERIGIAKFPFKIGRGSDMDLAILGDDKLSREHLVIEHVSGRFFAINPGNQNGFEINGRIVPNGSRASLLFDAEIKLKNSSVLKFVSNQSMRLPDMAGRVIDNKYRLIKLIKESQKSAVYLVENVHIQLNYALKIMSPDLLNHANYLEQFEREARLAAELKHENICNIQDYGHTVLEFAKNKSLKICYLRMDIMPGGSLLDRMTSDKPVPINQLCEWMRKLGGAFDHIHGQRIIHSGVKPSAIIFDQHEEPFLSDFAIANRLDADSSDSVIGAPDYLAPEQWDIQKATPATDQYALAVIAYRLVSSCLPYLHQEDPELRADNFHRGPVPAHERAAAKRYRDDVPAQVSRVLARALDTDPEKRYPSVGDFTQALQTAFLSREYPEAKLTQDSNGFDEKAMNSEKTGAPVETPKHDRDLASPFDVFLSHNSRNKADVISLAERLKTQKVNVWLDIW